MLPTYFDEIAQMEMVLVSAGEFLMGYDGSSSAYDDEKPQHKVIITEPFYLGKFEVTQYQWEYIMGNNPSHFKGPNLPVENVSWNDCQEYIKKLNEIAGELLYRLPTEAEWEYSCRAGTTGEYAGNLDDMAWYSDNSGGRTHPVGQKQPNAWGLYDMHGNVWEWCQDEYAKYTEDTRIDPGNPWKDSEKISKVWEMQNGVYIPVK